MGVTKSSIESRFWQKVEVTGFCWNWVASRDKSGYGYIAKPGGGNALAHRWSYEFLVGEIPEGYHVDHLCRNTSCVNPDHLEPVPQAENKLRGYGFGGKNARKTHCPQRHEYNDENTYIFPRTGHRQCLVCKKSRESSKRDSGEWNDYMRKWRAKKRQEALNE